ncbi:MAG: molybdopterin converting factor subunit 1 [Nitrososphaerales archaeon]
MTKEELDLLSVRVKLFASVRELVGKDEISVSLANQTTVGALRKKISEQYPVVSSKKITFVVAVNHKVANDSMPISHQDDVAILPPVSGG